MLPAEAPMLPLPLKMLLLQIEKKLSKKHANNRSRFVNIIFMRHKVKPKCNSTLTILLPNAYLIWGV